MNIPPREVTIEKRNLNPKIYGDDFSIYISTYPVFLEYLGKRIGDINKTLIELCSGIGITLINLSTCFKKIIGIDKTGKVKVELLNS